MLNYEQIGRHAERITKIYPFINEYQWEGIGFLSGKDICKKSDKNNVTIALNILCAKNKKYILVMFQKKIKLERATYSFDDFKLKRTLAPY